MTQRHTPAVGVVALLACAWSFAPSHAPSVEPDVAPASPHRHHRHHGDRRRGERHRHHHHRREHAPPSAPVAEPEAPPQERTDGCPEGMLRVEGAFCPDVRQRCEEMSDDGRERCLRFRKPSVCRSREREPMRFCIDRYEWPGREGATPAVLVSWNDAVRMCREAGRRLCTEDEWTLACEGPQMLPYPWGYTRDETVCNIDHHNLAYDRDAVTGNDREAADAEVDRVSQARPSGAYARCVSPYGVRDMTGNVDEWAVSRTGTPFQSALKGGYWGRIRARCRPATRRHDESFRYYQIGFRCCAEVASGR
ncbi:MAG: SUMF1/EgtB/PvdO family nonheme iron enzyme [Polyangiales bacterium]